MPPSFSLKVILITGAGSGIGRATAILLSSLGAHLALADQNTSSLSTVQSCLTSPSLHSTHTVDISSTDSVYELFTSLLAHHGRLDHIFNNAGINPTFLATEDVTDAYFERMMNVNVKGVFNVSREAIPHLKAGSAMVNMSSICGVMPFNGFAVYCASKWAVVGFSKCLALELGPKGIRTNVIAPGYIDTPTNAAVLEGPSAIEAITQRVSLGRMGTAAEVADVVAYLLSEESRYVNGSVVEITGGFHG